MLRDYSGFFQPIGGFCFDLVMHADGSRVTGTNPAKPGEIVVIYAVGLGVTVPRVPLGEAAPPSPASVAFPQPLVISFIPDLPPASPPPPRIWVPSKDWLHPEFTGLVPGYVGLYQVNVRLPGSRPPGTLSCGPSEFGGGNTSISIGYGSFGWAGDAIFAEFCVQPSPPTESIFQ